MKLEDDEYDRGWQVEIRWTDRSSLIRRYYATQITSVVRSFSGSYCDSDLYSSSLLSLSQIPTMTHNKRIPATTSEPAQLQATPLPVSIWDPGVAESVQTILTQSSAGKVSEGTAGLEDLPLGIQTLQDAYAMMKEVTSKLSSSIQDFNRHLHGHTIDKTGQGVDLLAFTTILFPDPPTFENRLNVLHTHREMNKVVRQMATEAANRGKGGLLCENLGCSGSNPTKEFLDATGSLKYTLKRCAQVSLGFSLNGSFVEVLY